MWFHFTHVGDLKTLEVLLLSHLKSLLDNQNPERTGMALEVFIPLPKSNSPFMKPHLNSIDPYCYLDLYQLAQTHNSPENQPDFFHQNPSSIFQKSMTILKKRAMLQKILDPTPDLDLHHYSKDSYCSVPTSFVVTNINLLLTNQQTNRW